MENHSKNMTEIKDITDTIKAEIKTHIIKRETVIQAKNQETVTAVVQETTLQQIAEQATTENVNIKADYDDIEQIQSIKSNQFQHQQQIYLKHLNWKTVHKQQSTVKQSKQTQRLTTHKQPKAVERRKQQSTHQSQPNHTVRINRSQPKTIKTQTKRN